ncbi:MAG: class II aldolase/adducin family protein [Spirochaetales bacterium]
MQFDLLHPADQIVLIMQRIYAYGMTTTSGGNLSIKDDNGDIWITPGGIDKGSLTRGDIVRVQPDGTVIGPHKPSSEFPFHKTVYDRRPDLKSVLHAHPPALVAFSIVRQVPQTFLIPHVHDLCGQIEYAAYALPGSKLLGDTIAEVFSRGLNTVLLENHGIVIGALDLFQAFMAFETLDFCARLEISARRMGKIRTLAPEQVTLTARKRQPPLPTFVPGPVNSAERAARRDLCALIHRSYDQRLVSSTQGTFSQRLEGNSFVITPYGVDRKYLEPSDLVRIENGRAEAGKTPSRSVSLHQRLYEAHPDIASVIIAHPPSALVFAVTEASFDSRTIPESYILLREVPKLPYGTNFTDPESIVKTLTSRTPIVLLENDCLMVAGTSLLNAFDRLEVADYSAQALIAAQELGPLVAINKEQVDELVVAFKLEK